MLDHICVADVDQDWPEMFGDNFVQGVVLGNVRPPVFECCFLILYSRARYESRLAGSDVGAFSQEYFHAAVACAAGGRVVVCDGIMLTLPRGEHAARINAT